jgi:hypothetical protein
MHAPDNNAVPESPREWWASPPRSGLRLIISPWEYRHLRACAGVRIGSAVVLTGLGLVTLTFGGNDRKTYGWTMAFLAPAAANLGFASWELNIARSAAASGLSQPRSSSAPPLQPGLTGCDLRPYVVAATPGHGGRGG